MKLLTVYKKGLKINEKFMLLSPGINFFDWIEEYYRPVKNGIREKESQLHLEAFKGGWGKWLF